MNFILRYNFLHAILMQRVKRRFDLCNPKKENYLYIICKMGNCHQGKLRIYTIIAPRIYELLGYFWFLLWRLFHLPIAPLIGSLKFIMLINHKIMFEYFKYILHKQEFSIYILESHFFTDVQKFWSTVVNTHLTQMEQKYSSFLFTSQ